MTTATEQHGLSGFPADQAARDRLSTALDETIFCEAGAGSGKTRALVDRILNLVDRGVDITTIAAITFTERAAAELRDRVRRALRDSIGDAPNDDVRQYRRSALDDVDGAAIGTLHGFARRLLAEHPIEAGIPLIFDLRDEISSRAAARRMWNERADALMGATGLKDELIIAQLAGVSQQRLRELAQSFDRSWGDITPVMCDDTGALDIRPIQQELLEALVSATDHAADCLATEDTMLATLATIKEYTELIAAASGARELFAVLSRPKPTFKAGRAGRKSNWPDIGAVRNAVIEAGEQREVARQTLLEHAIRRICTVLAAQVLAAAEHRQKVGEFTFDDLLVLARRLVCAHPEVRTALRARYHYLLLDEFQDTDPLQVDLAIRLAAPPDDLRHPDDLIPESGRIFTVGDPKQSIYRFRGADLPLYRGVGDRLTSGSAPAGSREVLNTNFRTVGPIIDWVNKVFSTVITEYEASQAAYVPLASFRGDRGLIGDAVTQLGVTPHDAGTPVRNMRIDEASDMAAVINHCMNSAGSDTRWTVEADGVERPIRLEDIAILLPRRTALPYITDALDMARIPYRTESSGLVYNATEIRMLMAALRAIEDPGNELALVTVLRSMLFGCGDDDLYRYRVVHGGSWNLLAPVPDGVPDDDPVAIALKLLRVLHGKRQAATPAQLLDELARQCRLLELGYLETRPRDLWHRVRFVIDQARAWSDSEGGSLQLYLEWVQLMTEDSAAVSEAILPDRDDDAVRILTVHASKGLEFPMVIVAGLSNLKDLGEKEAQVEFDGGSWEFWAGSKAISAGWQARAELKKQQAADELCRLLYVACTRARDHLVISTHRRVTSSGEAETSCAWTIADAAATAGAHEWHVAEPVRMPDAGESEVGAALPDHDEWLQEIERARSATTTPHAVPVTRIAHGHRSAPGSETDGATSGGTSESSSTATGPDHADETGVEVGSTARGRAVHRVLELVDLESNKEIDLLIEQTMAREDMTDSPESLISIIRSALDSDVLQLARGSRHWRELYVCGKLDDQLAEGVIDLLIEIDGELVIVDYKTDGLSAAEFNGRLPSYEEQVRCYARLLTAVSGRIVSRGVVLHVTETGATEHEVSLD